MNKEKEYKIFVKEMNKNLNIKSNIVFLCVGSNRVIGDCFGPMVGTKINELNFKKNITVIGNMKEPLCANNIKSKICKIDKNSYIVAIDSALSEYEAEGIYVSSKKMKLGSGIDKEILKIGDISIKGCVGKKKFLKEDNLYKLYKVYNSKIEQLSNIVSKGIFEILSKQL